MTHYKKCKRSKTKAERIIKSVARNFTASENGKNYDHAIVFIWPDSSLSFLFTGTDDMDVLPIGEKAHKIAFNAMGAAVDKVYFYKGENSWLKMENKSWKDMVAEQIEGIIL